MSIASSINDTVSIDTVVPRRVDTEMVQNVLLIWLDNNIDDNDDSRVTVLQLRQAINAVKTFTEAGPCIKFVDNIQDDKACMVISGSLGEQVVPRVHNMPQVDSIFIFCSNQQYHEQWAKEWPKIKGVFTDISVICGAVKEVGLQCERNAISISCMATDSDLNKKNLDELDPSFVYAQILKEILPTIRFNEKHFKEFIEYCCHVLAENRYELQYVNKLKGHYRDKTPICWYTSEFFLPSMLNRAFRLMDADHLIKLDFFIGDLHRQIEQLHKKQFGDNNSDKSFTVYRGQGIAKEKFEQMSNTKGGLLLFNSFLTTSKNSNNSLNFAQRATTNPDLVGILFVMTINPAISTTPFASITNVGYHQDKEGGVFFSIHAVFRIHDIAPIDENGRLFRVELTLIDNNDKDLRILTNRIQELTFTQTEGWQRMGQALLKMHESKKAEDVYHNLLKRATEETEIGRIYHPLGWLKWEKDEYKEAIKVYEKALEMYRKALPPTDPLLVNCYNHMGFVYSNLGDYPEALSYYQKALEIQQQSHPADHLDLAKSYAALGMVYNKMDEHSKAIAFYEKALLIQQQKLHLNHPDVALSYINIGSIYKTIGNYGKARVFYERAIEIEERTLPPNHPILLERRKMLENLKKKL